MTDILERLRGYNPPDRTIDGEMRTIAEDIHDAADEIERLRRTLEIIAGSASDKMQALQAKNALENIG